MRLEGVEPESVTVVNLLRSSVDLNSLEARRFVHALIVLSKLGGDLTVNTALLTMYSKFASLETARLLVDKMPKKDSVVWNLMISAYSRNGCPVEALKLLIQMGRLGIRADLFTALAAISSIVDMNSIQWGKQIHAHVIRNILDYQVSVHNSLIEMYGKCGYVESAWKVFDLLLDKSIISWSSVIEGYVKHGHYDAALSWLIKMRIKGIKVDLVTVINILPPCVKAGALETLQYLYGYSLKHGLNFEVSIVMAFLISYAKYGCMEMAKKLFSEEKVDSKDIVSWNSIISAYSKHGKFYQKNKKIHSKDRIASQKKVMVVVGNLRQ